MKEVILITSEDIDESGKEYLRERGYELHTLENDSPECIRRNIGCCSGLIVRGGNYTEDIFMAAPKLRVIARHGVGVEIIDTNAAAAHHIQVCNTPLANTNSVAEHTVMLILACARNLVFADRELRKGNYAVRDEVIGREVAGRVLGVIGFGRIGKEAARKAALGLDMKILVYEPKAELTPLPAYVAQVTELDELLRRSDFVTIHIPFTEETANLLDSGKLALLKPDAVLINAARGGIVDEKALYQALKAHKFAGAGFDVFVNEPFDNGILSPLFRLDNMIVTPHTAAATGEALGRMSMDAAISIDEVLSGKEPSWPVNRP